jgi:hypothetical protein
MTVSADRLKPFNPKIRPLAAGRTDSGPEREPENAEIPALRTLGLLLDAAQDAGIALRMLRDAAKMEIGDLAERLGMRLEDLEKAERGQLVERSRDGRLIDFSAALLVRVARVTKQESIPLPRYIGT